MSALKELVKLFYLRLLQIRAGRAGAFTPRGRVLVMAPHPDDEVFGCGGLIATLCAEGHAPHVVVLTGGGGSHRGCCPTPETEIVKARRELTRRAMTLLGLPDGNLHQLDFTDGSIGECFARPEYREQIEQLIARVKPDMILVPHKGEGWPDHLAVRYMGLELAPEGAEVWEYCVWFWYYIQRHLDWKNARQLKMTGTEHGLKLQAIDTYHSALAPCGKPWVGVLPPLFVKANSRNHELFFKIR